MTSTPTVTRLIEAIATWASARDDILGLALVGSYARNTANPASDVDFVLLTHDPNRFRESFVWLSEIDWSSLGLSIKSYRDARYGAVWSRHAQLGDGFSVEFSFARPSWAATSPCDSGTRSVLSGGCRVLFDPQKLLQNVVRCVAIANVPLNTEIELSLASRDEQPVVASYLQDYLAEFEFRGTYPYFEQYWLEPARHPFLITRRGKHVGFALVRSIDGDAAYEMSEFYVKPESRGSGVGRAAVEALLRIFPGPWSIPVQISNHPGITFWSRVLPSTPPRSNNGETVIFLHGAANSSSPITAK